MNPRFPSSSSSTSPSSPWAGPPDGAGLRPGHVTDGPTTLNHARREHGYLIPEVPELYELIAAAQRAVRAATHNDPLRRARERRDRHREWTALAVMGALGAPIPPFPQPEPDPALLDQRPVVAMRRLRAALNAVQDRPKRGGTSWRAADGSRLVAFRTLRLAPADVQILDQAAATLSRETAEFSTARDTRDGAAALRCLLAVLIPISDTETTILADCSKTGTGSSNPSRVLDERVHRAHRRVADRVLDALHRTA